MSFEDIIAKVKNQPAIWQRSCSSYNKRAVLERVWKEIAKELQVDEMLARKRWKNLKDQYRKEIRKVLAHQHHNTSKTNETEQYEPSWQYFNQLCFLKDEVISRDDGRARKMSDSESQSDSDDAPIIKRVKKTEGADKRDNHFCNISMDTSSKPMEIAATGANDKRIKIIMKRLRTINNKIELNKSNDALINDPEYMFLMSILPLMKNLTPIQQLHFRGKVNALLLEAFMQNECVVNPIGDNMLYLPTKIDMDKED